MAFHFKREQYILNTEVLTRVEYDMQLTTTVPNVPLKSFKRTKIIATVGPSTDSYEALLGLIEAGANGLRLNFSHGTHEERTRQIAWIRKAAQAYGKPVAI